MDWRDRFRARSITFSALGPDGRTGLVVANTADTYQLHVWEHGTLRQLTNEPGGRPFALLDPSGRYAVYIQDESGNETGHYVAHPLAGGDPIDLTPALPAYSSDDAGFSADNAGRRAVALVAHDDRVHLYRIGLDDWTAPSEPVELFSDDHAANACALSADGALAVVATSRASQHLELSLVVVDAATGQELATLSDGPGTSVSLGRCSPIVGDDRVVATTTRDEFERAFVWNARTGQRLALPANAPEGNLVPLDWSRDGRLILLCQIHEAEQRLFSWNLESSTMQRLAHPEGALVASLRFNASYYHPTDGTIVCRWEDFANPRRLLRLDAATGRDLGVLLEAGEYPPGRQLEAVRIPTPNGNVHAWLGVPDGERPFPTVIEIHGGPTAVVARNFHPEAQAWMDSGFAVLSLNYHGSVTFGREFERSIWGRLGDLELEDMVAARGWLVERGVAHADQIFPTGWSYGGYMTLLALGREPDLWAGGLAGVAIADWQMNYEDSADTLRGYLRGLFGGLPEQMPERLRESSPLTYVDRVRAPLLIIQGRNDTRTPARSIEVYEQRLRERGHRIEVDWFDAGHASGASDVELGIRQTERMIQFARSCLSGRVPGPVLSSDA